MNIYLKDRRGVSFVIVTTFAVTMSLMLLMMPYLMTPHKPTAFAGLQLESKSYLHHAKVLTSTNTYTYYLPLVLHNYYLPVWKLLGLEGSNIKDIAIAPGTSGVFYAATTEQYGIYKSIDSGNSWYRISNGLQGDARVTQVAVDPNQSLRVYATAPGYPRFYRSDNGGQPWQPGGDIPLIPAVLSPHSAITNRLFVGVGVWDVWGGGGWLYKSDDGGLNWTVVITQQVLASSIATSAIDPSFVYVGGNGLYRSQDSGDSFVSLTNTMHISRVEAVAIHPTNPLTAYVSTEVDIFKTTNGGDNWLWWSDQPPHPIQELLINRYNPEIQYSASRDCRGIYVSKDEGRHWHSINIGLGSLCINDLESNQEFTHLYAATTNGIWILDLTLGGQR